MYNQMSRVLPPRCPVTPLVPGNSGTVFFVSLFVDVNKTGVVLPSTGGIGATIFYILGGLLVIGLETRTHRGAAVASLAHRAR